MESPSSLYPVIAEGGLLGYILHFSLPLAATIPFAIYVFWQLGLLPTCGLCHARHSKQLEGVEEKGVNVPTGLSSATMQKATSPLPAVSLERESGESLLFRSPSQNDFKGSRLETDEKSKSVSPSAVPPPPSAPFSPSNTVSTEHSAEGEVVGEGSGTRCPSPNPPPPDPTEVALRSKHSSAAVAAEQAARFPSSPFFSRPSDEDEADAENEEPFLSGGGDKSRKTRGKKLESKSRHSYSNPQPCGRDRSQHLASGSPSVNRGETVNHERASTASASAGEQGRDDVLTDVTPSTDPAVVGSEENQNGLTDAVSDIRGQTEPLEQDADYEGEDLGEEEYEEEEEEEEEIEGSDLHALVLNLDNALEFERRRIDELQNSMRTTMQMLSATLNSLRMLDAPSPLCTPRGLF